MYAYLFVFYNTFVVVVVVVLYKTILISIIWTLLFVFFKNPTTKDKQKRRASKSTHYIHVHSKANILKGVGDWIGNKNFFGVKICFL